MRFRKATDPAKLLCEKAQGALGAAGGVSVPTCKYLQGAELADTSEKKVDFSGSVQAGLFTPTLGFLIGMMGYQQTSVPRAARSRQPPYQRC